ncbi:MAG: tRNA pseudouridine(55) synthase TruB [Bacteroidetes bacterium]|nr:MAG: tRNA pseudouridine(55) synthase TruB [Bacteroidota bacterium]
MDYTDPNTYLEGRVLFIDKPLTWTSFDVVNKIRKSLRHHLGIGKIKVGHAGTLDPLATGLVIICTGKATKQIMQYQNLDKLYEAQVRLGATTPSFDLETEVDKSFPWEHITSTDIGEAINAFKGDLEQMPPLYSAKRVDGKRAYDMARKGKTLELKPQYVTIHRLEILKENLPDLSLLVECSKGTYIRSLARDIGEKLNSGAHLTGLRRTRIGPYEVEQAISIDNFIKKLELL